MIANEVMRWLVAEDSQRLPGTIDIRWNLVWPSGKTWKSPHWANCKNDKAFRSFVADCRREGWRFEVLNLCKQMQIQVDEVVVELRSVHPPADVRESGDA